MVEFDYKQPETERRQNESQRDVMTFYEYCAHFGKVSGQFIVFKHNFRTQQKETQIVAHQLATCSETLMEFRKTHSFHIVCCDRSISSSKESSPQSVI